MKWLRSVGAYALAAFIVQLSWAKIATPFGLLAGLVGAIVAIGPAWYLAHYRQLIAFDEDNPAIDMGGAIATCVLVRSIFNAPTLSFFNNVPTLFLIALGATIGGFTAAKIEKGWQSK